MTIKAHSPLEAKRHNSYPFKGAHTPETIPQKIEAALQKLGREATEKELELANLVASIYESVKETSDSMSEMKEEAMTKARKAASSVNNAVRSRPWYYVGGAILIGFMGGFTASSLAHYYYQKKK